MTEDLPCEQWDFRDLDPDEAKFCYALEFSLESPMARAGVAAARMRIPKFRDWIRSNPHPQPPGSPEFIEWAAKGRAASLEVGLPSNLSSRFPFLFNLDTPFPSKHWLEIPKEQRRTIIEECIANELMVLEGDPAALAAAPLSIQPLEEVLADDRISLVGSIIQSQPVTPDINRFVFSFSWQRSNRQLLGDFKKWLETRPKDQPDLEHTKQSPSKKTSPGERLKWLTALRLVRHYGGRVNDARDYYYERTDTFLYRDDSAWRKAERKAHEEIRRFDRLAS